jgi:hypothetical protein
VNNLNANLHLQQKEYRNIQNEMLELQAEARELEEKLKQSECLSRSNSAATTTTTTTTTHTENSSTNECTTIHEDALLDGKKQQQVVETTTKTAEEKEEVVVKIDQQIKMTKSLSVIAAAAAAKWRLVEVKKSLNQKSLEIVEAKAQAKALAEEMEEKMSEFSFQSERLKMMQQCLSLGLNKYSSEGACFGFALQQGTIFGSLNDGSSDSSSSEIWRVSRELGAGRRGAFVVKSLSTNQVGEYLTNHPCGERERERH